MINQLLNPTIYKTEGERDRARLIYLITVSLMALFTVYALFIDNLFISDAGTSSDPLTSAQIALVRLYILGVVTLVATWRGWHLVSGVGPIVMWYFSGIQLALQDGFVNPANSITLVILVMLSGLLMRAVGIIGGFMAAIITLLAVYGQGLAVQDPRYDTGELLTMVLQISGTAILIYLYLRSTHQTSLATLERAGAERLTLATLSTEIAQRISRRLDLQDLLTVTVEQIRESFPDIYHAQIFLLDNNKTTAWLVASTGEIGQRLLSRQHSLPVGSQSVIGHVTASGDHVVAYAERGDSFHRRNELLPETAIEAAFPLRIGDSIIGALDLQSRRADAFPPGDLPIFQALADNIALAIDNAQLTEQTAERLRENQQLLEQMRDAMQQVERLNRQLTAQAWTEYLAPRQDRMAITLDFDQQQASASDEWTPTLTEAVHKNTLIRQQNAHVTTVAVPLRVRGQVIGAMEFELEDTVLNPEDTELVNTVSERLGLALESARLYDESRRVAHREAMLNEISGRLQSSNNVDSVLNEAARSLQSTLGAQRVAIRLGTPVASGEQQRNGAR